MTNRLDLQKKFEEIVGKGHVYFQPPENVKLKYPCIIYNLNSIDHQYADDQTYIGYRRYDVTYITKDPDDILIEQIVYTFPLLRLDRCFTSDNLNHYNYTLYSK